MVYNVHSLIHLTADVDRFGPLDAFSAFKYENFLGIIKRKLRHGNLPMQQVINRLNELSNVNTNKKNEGICSIIPGKRKDSCVELENGDHGFVFTSDSTGISFAKLVNRSDAFVYPCQSSLLKMYSFNKIETTHRYIKYADIKAKCFSMFYDNSWFTISL